MRTVHRPPIRTPHEGVRIGGEIDWKIARKIAPYFIYQRIIFNAFRGFLTQKIDYGFNYFLRRIWVAYESSWSTTGTWPANKAILPNLFVEFFDKGNFKARQASPIPLDLITATRRGSIRVETQQNGQYNMTANAPKYSKFLNFLYVNGDVIDVEITGQSLTNQGVTAYQPSMIDVMLEGYYIPDETLKMWKGA